MMMSKIQKVIGIVCGVIILLVLFVFLVGEEEVLQESYIENFLTLDELTIPKDDEVEVLEIISEETLIRSIFIDSPVSGLNYSTQDYDGVEKRGTTTKDGSFWCLPGKQVSFYLGTIFVGSSSCSFRPVTPFSFGQKEELSQDIMRVLQSLDKDNNVDNGIQISEKLSSFEKGGNLQKILISQKEEDIQKIFNVVGQEEEFEKFKNLTREQAQKNFNEYQSKIQSILDRAVEKVRNSDVYENNFRLKERLEEMYADGRIIFLENMVNPDDSLEGTKSQEILRGEAYAQGHGLRDQDYIRINASSDAYDNKKELVVASAGTIIHELVHILDYEDVQLGQIDSITHFDIEVNAHALQYEFYQGENYYEYSLLKKFDAFIYVYDLEEDLMNDIYIYKQSLELGEENNEKRMQAMHALLKRRYLKEDLNDIIWSGNFQEDIQPEELAGLDIPDYEKNMQYCLQKMRVQKDDDQYHYFYKNDQEELIFDGENYGEGDSPESSNGNVLYRRGNDLYYNGNLVHEGVFTTKGFLEYAYRDYLTYGDAYIYQVNNEEGGDDQSLFCNGVKIDDNIGEFDAYKGSLYWYIIDKSKEKNNKTVKKNGKIVVENIYGNFYQEGGTIAFHKDINGESHFLYNEEDLGKAISGSAVLKDGKFLFRVESKEGVETINYDGAEYMGEKIYIEGDQALGWQFYKGDGIFFEIMGKSRSDAYEKEYEGYLGGKFLGVRKGKSPNWNMAANYEKSLYDYENNKIVKVDDKNSLGIRRIFSNQGDSLVEKKDGTILFNNQIVGSGSIIMFKDGHYAFSQEKSSNGCQLFYDGMPQGDIACYDEKYVHISGENLSFIRKDGSDDYVIYNGVNLGTGIDSSISMNEKYIAFIRPTENGTRVVYDGEEICDGNEVRLYGDYIFSKKPVFDAGKRVRGAYQYLMDCKIISEKQIGIKFFQGDYKYGHHVGEYSEENSRSFFKL